MKYSFVLKESHAYFLCLKRQTSRFKCERIQSSCFLYFMKSSFKMAYLLAEKYSYFTSRCFTAQYNINHYPKSEDQQHVACHSFTFFLFACFLGGGVCCHMLPRLCHMIFSRDSINPIIYYQKMCNMPPTSLPCNEYNTKGLIPGE